MKNVIGLLQKRIRFKMKYVMILRLIDSKGNWKTKYLDLGNT